MMDVQHTYTHTCHHIAHGPILSNPLIYLPLTTHTRSLLSLPKINLKIPFRCPFCEDPGLHDTVPAGKGVLVIMSSPKKEEKVREVMKRSTEPVLLPWIPLIHSASYHPYPSTFYSRSHPQSPPFPYFTPHLSFAPFYHNSPPPKFPDPWKIIRICGVEDIKSKEWAQGIETEITDDQNAMKHPENEWSERRQNFVPREGKWIPMAWIPKPAGDVDVLTIPDTEPQSASQSFTNSRFPHSPDFSSSSHSNLDDQNQNQKLHISQAWRGTAGEDSNGYGYRGRILSRSRLPGMMSELGAFLRNRRAEDGSWGSRMDVRERMRERGVRWE